MLLFVARLKRLRNPRYESEPVISAGDIKRAEAAWIMSVQQSCFNWEIQFLFTHKCACPILVYQFDLFIDDEQLICCQGRMNNSELSLASKKPVLLPTKHPLLPC